MNNDYADPFLLENPPAQVDITKLQRNILADKPRVTRFPIDWSPAGAQDPNAAAADASGVAAMGVAGAAVGGEIDMDFVDDEELVKAAAQLDHNYTDIVIGGGNDNDQMDEDIDLDDDDDDDDESVEDDEADSVEEAEEDGEDGDQDMDMEE